MPSCCWHQELSHAFIACTHGLPAMQRSSKIKKSEAPNHISVEKLNALEKKRINRENTVLIFSGKILALQKLFQKFPFRGAWDCVFRLQHLAPPKAPAAASSVPKKVDLSQAIPLLLNVILQTNHGCSAFFADLGNLNQSHQIKPNILQASSRTIFVIYNQYNARTKPQTIDSPFPFGQSTSAPRHRVPQHRRQSPWISSPTSGWTYRLETLIWGPFYFDLVFGFFIFLRHIYIHLYQNLH